MQIYAEYLAFKELLNHLNLVSENIDADPRNLLFNNHHSENSGIEWVDTKSDLVELIISLQESVKIKGKQPELKSLFKVLGGIFNVQLTTAYQIIGDLRKRKNRHQFIDKLMQRVLEKKDEKSSCCANYLYSPKPACILSLKTPVTGR